MELLIIGVILRINATKREAKDRSAARVGPDGYLATMGLDDGPGNRQPDTHALPLRGYERLEQP